MCAIVQFKHPKWSKIMFEKTHIWAQNGPLLRILGKRLKPGSRWAHFTCLCTPTGLRSLLKKRVFDPFLAHFQSILGFSMGQNA